MEYSLEISASTTYFTYTRIEHLRIACEKKKPLRERDLHCFLQNKKRKNRGKKKQAVDLLSKTVTVAAEDGIHLVCRGFAGCAFSLLLSLISIKRTGNGNNMRVERCGRLSEV